MPRMSARTLLMAVSAISLLGCGSSSDGSQGAAFGTSVNPDIPLADLNSQQATQLCNEVTRANTTKLGPTLCDSLNQSGALNTTGIYLGQNPTATDADLRTE